MRCGHCCRQGGGENDIIHDMKLYEYLCKGDKFNNKLYDNKYVMLIYYMFHIWQFLQLEILAFGLYIPVYCVYPWQLLADAAAVDWTIDISVWRNLPMFVSQ